MFLRAIREQYQFELIGLSQMNIMAPFLDHSERKFTPRTTPPTGAGNIYVTLADGRYVIGAMALARSLAKVTETPLLDLRSEEHTSELQSLMRNSSALLCWKK